MSEIDSTPRPAARGRPGGIAVVGPCGAGKSTLIAGLRSRGILARQIAQEHSHVRDLWRRRATPHLLIYLDASYPVCTERKRFDWPVDDYREQLRRLELARRECDVFVRTDDLTPEAVLEQVLASLAALGPSDSD